jgi:hypothetical protein
MSEGSTLQLGHISATKQDYHPYWGWVEWLMLMEMGVMRCMVLTAWGPRGGRGDSELCTGERETEKRTEDAPRGHEIRKRAACSGWGLHFQRQMMKHNRTNGISIIDCSQLTNKDSDLKFRMDISVHGLSSILIPCFFKIHYNIILPIKFRSLKWSLPLRFSNSNFVCSSYLFHACYMPRPPCIRRD